MLIGATCVVKLELLVVVTSEEAINIVSDVLSEAHHKVDTGLLAKILREVRVLDVPGILPILVLLEQIERQHAPSERFGGRVVTEGPVQRRVVVFEAGDPDSGRFSSGL